MRSISRRKSFSVTVAMTILLTGTTACTQSGVGHPSQGAPTAITHGDGELSRVKLYGSLAQLSLDSQAVVVGTVTDQRVVADITPTTDFTLADFSISKVIKPAATLTQGTSIVVRQTGSEKQPTGAPFLKTGNQYLLFLVPSGLQGELASQFYITGASAGIFALDPTKARDASAPSGTSVFTRYDPQSGDSLPLTLTPSQVSG